MKLGPLQIVNAEQGSATWLRAREGRLTGSDAGRILTDTGSPRTGAQVETYALEKAGELLYGETIASFSSSAATEHGHEQEPKARAAYALERMVDVEQIGFAWREPGIGCSPDGLIGEDGMLEVKAPLAVNALRYRRHVRKLDAAPGAFMAQIAWNLWAMDRAWCDLVIWAAHHELDEQLCVVRVERDAQWDAACAEAAAGVLAMRDAIVEAERPAGQAAQGGVAGATPT